MLYLCFWTGREYGQIIVSMSSFKVWSEDKRYCEIRDEVILEHHECQYAKEHKGSRNRVGNGQSLCTNLRIRDISNLAPNQTKVKSQFIVTNGDLICTLLIYWKSGDHCFIMVEREQNDFGQYTSPHRAQHIQDTVSQWSNNRL